MNTVRSDDEVAHRFTSVTEHNLHVVFLLLKLRKCFPPFYRVRRECGQKDMMQVPAMDGMQAAIFGRNGELRDKLAPIGQQMEAVTGKALANDLA
ncbi:hypothetical protein D3C71_2000900 [compost metagenome]